MKRQKERLRILPVLVVVAALLSAPPALAATAETETSLGEQVMTFISMIWDQVTGSSNSSEGEDPPSSGDLGPFINPDG